MVTDNFNRADGGLGGNWTTLEGDPQIVSNEVAGTVAGDHSEAWWSADSFPDNQYSQLLAKPSANNGVGPTTRAAATRSYLFAGDGSQRKLYRRDSASSFTVLQDYGGTITEATIRLESRGSIHKAYVSGSQIGTDQTDTTHASGAAGLLIYSNEGANVDDWQGGFLGVPI